MLLFQLLIKNFRILLRNPLTLFLLVIGPIALMFLVGIAFSGGSEINEIKIGIIQDDENSLFTLNNNIKLVNFLGEKQKAKEDCIKSLDKNIVKLCIELDLNKNSKGEILSAKVNYYVDNTKHQLSSLLENSLDRYLVEKEKEFSKVYLDSIFSQANEGLKLMKESKDYLDKIEENIIYLEGKVNESKNEIESSQLKYDEEINFVKNETLFLLDNIDEVNAQIDETLSLLKNTNEKIIILEDKIIPLTNSSVIILDKTIRALPENFDSKIKNDIVEVRNDINQINEFKSDFDLINENIIQGERILSNLTLYFNENNLNEFLEIIENGENNISEFKNKLNETLLFLNYKKNQIEDLKLNLDEMIAFLESSNDVKSEIILNPIEIKKNYRFSGLTKVHQLSPIIVMMVILFVGILLSNTIVSLEVNSKAYFRNILSPIPQGTYIFGLFLTVFIIILLELFVLFLFLEFYFGIGVFANIWDLFLIIFHIVTPIILLGIFFAYLFNNSQISTLISTFVVMGLFLLSNVILPLELMPVFFSEIIKYNPVVIGNELLREVFFYSSFNFNLHHFLFLYLYSFVFIGLIQFAHRRRKNNSL